MASVRPRLAVRRWPHSLIGCGLAYVVDLGVLRIHGLESEGFVARGELVVGDGDDGEAFGRSHAGALPPVAADGSAGDVRDAVPLDSLVDVGVALEDAENVVAFEEADDLV